jgi:hypothetical protein
MPVTNLKNIPKIMRANRWDNGARLLDIWFSRPFARKPHYGVSDKTTIRLDSWLLTFPRARKAYQTILDEKIWASDGAQRVIADQLRRTGAAPTRSFVSFGNLGLDVEKLHELNVNHQPVSQFIPDLDDLTAALGNFSLYVSVAGSCRAGLFHKFGRLGYEVFITEVEIHVMDSFDFEGNQSLGYWDEESNSVVLHPRLEDKYIEPGVPPAPPKYEYTEVTNKSFREWRDKNGKGGDFRVFSDMKRIKLSRPDELFVA